jgi:hypothetical protein
MRGNDLIDLMLKSHRRVHIVGTPENGIIADAPPEQLPSDFGVNLSIYCDPADFMEIEACGGYSDTLVPGTELGVNVTTEYFSTLL